MTTINDQNLALTLYQAFKRSNDIMFYADKNAVIQDVNDAFVKTYGFKREEAVGMTPRILRSRHSSDELYRRMWSCLLDPKKNSWRGEIINKAKDGREIPLILTISAVRDSAGEIVGYISNAFDLTEHMALQHRVAQSEALANLGEMAAIVSHEIRNPLGSIVMAAKQLSSDKLDAADRRLVLDILNSESQRLNAVLSNFLSYARPREIKLQNQDLNKMLREICAMVGSNRELVKDVRFSLSLDSNLKPFPMDSDQIRQVIWNIVLNAVQAMNGSGEITLATGRDSGQVRLVISDTGPGISPEAIASVFKPFHTTKKQGTGLGLAIAERIVKAHGGRIEAASPPGQGACFTISLPCAES